MVGCGQSEIDTKIITVNPEIFCESNPGEIGEIWVSASTVAQGYWQKKQETQKTFNAYLADTGEGPFLRTGDLGFIYKGELFITGRLKDVIIIRGRNYYPQDLEVTVEKSHPALRANCSAAFDLEREGEEQLVIAAEIERTYLRKLNKDEVTGKIREAFATQHGLEVHGILFLKTGSIPKTSSGKIQPHACRQNYLNRQLNLIEEYIFIRGSVKTNTTDRKQQLLETFLTIPEQEREQKILAYLQT